MLIRWLTLLIKHDEKTDIITTPFWGSPSSVSIHGSWWVLFPTLGEIKWIYNINDWKPYAGIHLGIGVYETKEQSKSNNSSINTYQNNVHEQGLFQLGFSIGSYYELTEGLLLDLSISTNFGSRSVDFFDVKSYNYQQGMATYENKSSTPCLLLFNIGLTLELENLRDSGENDDFEQHREINIPPARTPAPRPAPHPKTPRKRGHHSR